MIVYQLEYFNYDEHSNNGIFATYEAAEKALSVIALRIKKERKGWKEEISAENEMKHYCIEEYEVQLGVEY